MREDYNNLSDACLEKEVGSGADSGPLVEITCERTDAGGLAQFVQSLRFNLANSFARQAHFVANLLQCESIIIVQSKT